MHELRATGGREPFITPCCRLVMSLFSKNVSRSAIAVLLCLMTHSNRDNGKCFPSVKKIAAETRLNRGSVHRAVVELRNKGFIDWVRGGFREGKNLANAYCINDPSYHARLFDKPVWSDLEPTLSSPELDTELEPELGPKQEAEYHDTFWEDYMAEYDRMNEEGGYFENGVARK